MQRIGILGGLSPRSTARYYDIITSTHAKRSRDLSSPEIVVFSVNFKKFVGWQRAGRWDEVREVAIAALGTLAAAEADFALVAASTIHHIFGELEDQSPIPLLSQVECVADEISRAKHRTVGLLGTRFTMEESFFSEGLDRRGLRVLTPEKSERKAIDDMIYGDLVCGLPDESSRRTLATTIENLARRGAEAVVLACTELGDAAEPAKSPVPLFDVTEVHALAALDRATAK